MTVLRLFSFLKKKGDLEPQVKHPPLNDLPPFPDELMMTEMPPEEGTSDLMALGLPKIETDEALKPKEMLLPLESRELEKIKLPKLSPLVLEGAAYEQKATKKEYLAVHAREHLQIYKPLFVGGLHFRKVLANIISTRTMLEECEEHLCHWDHVEKNKETHFDHLRILIEQAQRKLIFMDKTLFER